MKEKAVISIARQFGSGGREVAKKVAEILGIPFYDKELIALAAKESGLSEKMFEGLEEKPTTSLLYSLVMGLQAGGGVYTTYGDVGVDNAFRIQSQIIKEVSEKGPCVIVGRCADYILRENPNLVSVFVHADIDFRAERIMKEYDMKEKAALDYATKTDKRRASFYNFNTNRTWGSVDNYDLSIATHRLGIDNAAELIVDYVENI